MDTERLQRRVDGRTQAKAIFDLLTLDHPDKIAAFFDELDSRFRPKTEVAKQIERRKIRELSVITIDFGAHSGKQMDEIPREYLSWLLESSEQTCSDIREYLEATAERGSPDDVGDFEIEDTE
jgi:uncharacterized protein (DUF3820 family)